MNDTPDQPRDAGGRYADREASAAPPPGERLRAQLPGDTLAAQIDALHARTFAGGRLAGGTDAWNLVHGFKEELKRLVAEHAHPQARVAGDTGGAAATNGG